MFEQECRPQALPVTAGTTAMAYPDAQGMTSARFTCSQNSSFPVFKDTEFTSNGVRPAFKYSSTSGAEKKGWQRYQPSDKFAS
jgi:hypothetical protein